MRPWFFGLSLAAVAGLLLNQPLGAQHRIGGGTVHRGPVLNQPAQQPVVQHPTTTIHHYPPTGNQTGPSQRANGTTTTFSQVKGVDAGKTSTATTAAATTSKNPTVNKLLAAGVKPKVPASLMTLSAQQRRGLQTLREQLKTPNFPLHQPLNLQQQNAVHNWMNAHKNTLSPQEFRALDKARSGQQLNRTEAAQLAGVMGRPDMPPAVAGALGQVAANGFAGTGSGLFPQGAGPALVGDWVGMVAQPPLTVADNGDTALDPAVSIVPDDEVQLAGQPQPDSQTLANIPVAQRSDTGTSPVPANTPIQDRRYLRVSNKTGARLTVYVQYQTSTKRGTWEWFPGLPGSDRVVAYHFAPGQELDLSHEDWPLSANRVRIWGVTEKGEEMSEYRAQDLWLVGLEYNRQHLYQSAQAETYTFTFWR